MANVKIGTTFTLPTSIYSVTAQSSSFPATNMFDYKFPLRPWKSGTTSIPGTMDIRMAVPTSPAIKGIYIRHTNASSITIRVSSSSTFASVAGSIAGAATKDTRTNRYNFITSKSTTVAAEGTMSYTSPYLEVSFKGTTVDSSDNYSCGSIYFITSISELNHTWQFPFRVRRSSGVIRQDRANLSSRVISLDTPKVFISFPANLAVNINSPDWTTNGEVQFYNIISQSTDTGFIFWENRVREGSELVSRAYHVRPAQDVEVVYSNQDLVIESTLEFEEIT